MASGNVQSTASTSMPCSAATHISVASARRTGLRPQVASAPPARQWSSLQTPASRPAASPAAVVTAAVIAIGAGSNSIHRRSRRHRLRRPRMAAVAALGGESDPLDAGLALADEEDGNGQAAPVAAAPAYTTNSQTDFGYASVREKDKLYQKKFDCGSHLQPGRPLDYVSVKLQSPSEIRHAAKISWSTKIDFAEMTSKNDWAEDRSPHPDGLLSVSRFGDRVSVGRRYQMGCLDLDWPCSHVWFTGSAKSAHVPKLLGITPSEGLLIRNFKADMYLGNWVAPNFLPLRQKLGSSVPEMPAVGSPVAAHSPAQLRQGSLRTVEAQRDLASDVPMPALERSFASGLSSAWSQNVSPHIARRSRAAHHAVAMASRDELSSTALKDLAKALCLVAELPEMATEAYAEIHFQNKTGDARGQDDSEMASDVVRQLVEAVVDKCSKAGNGLDRKTIGSLLRSIVMGEGQLPSMSDHPLLRDAAQKDIVSLWSALAAPSSPHASVLHGDRNNGAAGFVLGKHLNELKDELNQEIDSYEGARLEAVMTKFQDQAYAALDVVLKVYDSTASAVSAPSTGSRSRFAQEEKEVCWYDSGIPPASFHVEDIQRLTDRISLSEHVAEQFADLVQGRLGDLALSKSGATGKKPGAKGGGKGKAKSEATAASQGISRPSRSCRRSASQEAGARWHLPMKNHSRAGRGAGARVMEVGQFLPLNTDFSSQSFASELARFHSIQPRPAFEPKPAPANLTLQGACLVSTGGAALRQVLCDIEPRSFADAAAKRRTLVDSAMLVQEFMERLKFLGFATESTRDMKVPLASTAGKSRKDLLKIRKSLEAMAYKVQQPESMILLTLPILPPDLRTTGESTDYGETSGDQMHGAYKLIMSSGAALQEAIADCWSSGLIRYKMQQLQYDVDCYMDNGRVQEPRNLSNGEAMPSVASRLKGKEGRMRTNMLGKRVDFSARTVIVVDPLIELDKCCIPYFIAREIFKGFLIAVLRETYCDKHEEMNDWKNQEKFMDFFDALELATRYELLKKAMGDRLVMLNRAPTLHRLSIQSFIPILTDGQAIKIHPLVCAPFNADFDGDTMSLHLSVSEEAQSEQRKLMMPSCNLNSPADGEPVIGPTQDMVLGLYYLTSDPLDGTTPVVPFPDIESVAEAHAHGDVTHDTFVSLPTAAIKAVAPIAVEHDPLLQEAGELVTTTVGRVLFFRCVHCAGQLTKTIDDHLLDDLEAQLPKVNEWSDAQGIMA